LKSDESCSSNPKSEIANWTVRFTISDFGFELQDLSDFEIPLSSLMLESAAVILLLLILLLAIPTQAKSNFNAQAPEQFVCNTNLDRTVEAVAIARQNRQKLALALGGFNQTTTDDLNNIAILRDDGTVLTSPNRLDVGNSSIAFVPVVEGLFLRYSVLAGPAAFDNGEGSAVAVGLGDDDSAQISLPFPFTFYGTSYTNVFLNTDGNLTFVSGDNASSPRSLSRITGGSPRIAPLFDDLNPAGSAQITVERLADRVLFTWTDVGEWTSTGSRGSNTFQVILQSDSRIRFNYKSLNATDAVVAVSAGTAVRTSAPFSVDELSLVNFTSFINSPGVRPGTIAEVFASTQQLDLARVTKLFYDTHADVYDGVVVFTDFGISLGGAFAYATPVRNNIRGITTTSRSTYDFGSEFGSESRLSVVVNMGDVTRYPSDPYEQFLGTNNSLSILGQEFGHRWLAFLDAGPASLLGRDQAHWSFLHNTLGSVMEGNEIEDLGGGRFRTIGATVRYSPLDQYVMGLRPAAEVPPWFVVANPTLQTPIPVNFPSSCRILTQLPACGPFVGIQLSGSRHDLTIEDIVTAAGPRIPGYDEAQKDFRVAFILVTQANSTVKAGSLEKLSALRSEWESFFGRAVDARGTMNTDLLYVSPQITAVSPDRGTVSGGTAITITGTGFALTSGVTIGDRPATVLFRNKSTLVVEAPFHAPGPVSVVVIGRDGQSATRAGGFTYFTPTQTERRMDIPANGSRSVITTGEDPLPHVGYAALEGAFGMSVIRSVSGSDVISEVAIPAAAIGTTFRVYIERSEQTSTGLAIVNTATAPASINLVLSDGRQATMELGARNQIARFIHELFPDIGASFQGTLSLSANVPVAVVGLHGTFNRSKEFIMAAMPVSASSASTETVVFPQIADGFGFATDLILLNPNVTALSGTLEFSFVVATDRGAGPRFAYDIPPGASWTLRTAGVRSDVQVGYATLLPNSGTAAPSGTALLRQSTNGNVNFETAVQAARALSRGVIFGLRDARHRTALAIANRAATTTNIRLTAYWPDPTSVVASNTIAVTSNSHRAAFLDELLPQLPNAFEGTVMIESDSPIHVVTLQTVTNASGAFLMTGMPVIDLSQPLPSTSYFPQVVDGGNYSNEFLLFNTNPGTIRLQFFTPDGQPLALPLQ
jgi:hypothetical protein